LVSYPLSAPSVSRRKPRTRACSINSDSAARSAVPVGLCRDRRIRPQVTRRRSAVWRSPPACKTPSHHPDLV
jgi:hypothetical protein